MSQKIISAKCSRALETFQSKNSENLFFTLRIYGVTNSASQLNSVSLQSCLKFYKFSKNFSFINFFNFQGVQISKNLRCLSYQSFSFDLEQEFLENNQNSILFQIIRNSIFEKNVKRSSLEQFVILNISQSVKKESRYFI